MFGRGLAGLGRDLMHYIPSSVAPSLVALASLALVTRAIGPSAYGEFSVWLVWANLAGALVSSLAAQASGRFFAACQAEGQLDAYWATMVVLTSISGGAVAVLWALTLGAATALHIRVDEGVLTAAGLYVLLQSVYSMWLPVLPAGFWRREYLAATFVASIATLIATLGALVVWRGALASLLAAGAIGAAAGCVPIATCLAPKLQRLTYWTFGTRKLLARFVRFGGPMTAWFVAASVLAVGDRIVMAVFLGTGAVGVYAVSYNLASRASALLATPSNLVAWPRLMEAWAHGNKTATIEILRSVCNAYSWVVAIIAGPAIFGGTLLVTAFAGTAYGSAGSITGLVFFGASLSGLSTLLHKGLELTENTGLLLVDEVAMAAVNIGLNIVLIPAFGLTGAAIVTLISYAGYTGLVAAQSGSRLEGFWTCLSGSALAAITACVAMLLARSLVSDLGGVAQATVRTLLYEVACVSCFIVFERKHMRIAKFGQRSAPPLA